MFSFTVNIPGAHICAISMYSFDQRMMSAVDNSGTKGWLVAILELGAWVGVLLTGYLADKLSRKYTIVLGQCWLTVFLLLVPLISTIFRQ